MGMGRAVGVPDPYGTIRRIKHLHGRTGLSMAQEDELLRLMHSSGDPGLAPVLSFSAGACEAGMAALAHGAVH